jgi:hypothetical protein
VSSSWLQTWWVHAHLLQPPWTDTSFIPERCKLDCDVAEPNLDLCDAAFLGWGALGITVLYVCLAPAPESAVAEPKGSSSKPDSRVQCLQTCSCCALLIIVSVERGRKGPDLPAQPAWGHQSRSASEGSGQEQQPPVICTEDGTGGLRDRFTSLLSSGTAATFGHTW